MSTTLLFDHDPVTGTVQRFHALGEGGFAIESTTDVEPVVEHSKTVYNTHDQRARWKSWNWVASIPMPIYMALVKSGVAKDPKAFARWLNDPDQRAFRTRPGRV